MAIILLSNKVEPVSKRKYVVTGGAGFVGSHLVELLLAQGHDVTVVDDLSSGRIENLNAVRSQITFAEGSILDADFLQRHTEGAGGIFHLAAVVSVPRSIDEPLYCHEVNLTGTLQVLEAARRVGADIVFSSSAAIYGNVAQVPVAEESIPSPISPYGVQKLAGEQYLDAYRSLFGINARSLRYFNIFGPRQDPSSPYSGVISAFAARASKSAPLTINGDGTITRDFVYVGDVAKANLLAMHTSGPSINIGTGVETTLDQLATEIVRLSGGSSEIGHGPERPGDILRSCARVSLAEDEIGFRAKEELTAGLEKTLDSLKS